MINIVTLNDGNLFMESKVIISVVWKQTLLLAS